MFVYNNDILLELNTFSTRDKLCVQLELNQLIRASELMELEEEPSTNTLLITIINNYILNAHPYTHI